jgi:CHAT domain-containing protein
MKSPRWRTSLLGAAVASVLTACGPSDPVDELRDRATEVRVVEPRWSGVRVHRPCEASEAQEPGRCASPSEFPDVSRWIDLVHDVEVVAQRAESSGPALRALAVVDVVTAGTGSADLDRAIDRLRGATQLDPDDPDVLNDLTVALLVRGTSTGRTWDLTEALEKAEQALLIDPGHGAASFNRALALDRLHLSGEATRAWGRVAEVDADRAWAEEARTRQQAVRGRVADEVDAVPQVDALTRRIAALIRSDPESNAGAGAESRDEVRRQAEELAGRGERGALDLMEALDRPGAARNPRLVEAIVRYVEALDLWRAGANAESQSMYRRVEALADGPTPGDRFLRWRAAIGASRWSVYESAYDVAEAEFESVLTRSVGMAAAETRGHARWGLGLSTGRRGDYSTAHRHLTVAESLFVSLGQSEQYGSVRSLKAEILGIHGATDEALDELVAALPLFGRDGGNMHQNLLSIAGRMVATRHPRAATAFHREGLALSEARENPQYRVEALIRLAQSEARSGESDLAVRHLEAARAGLPEIQEAVMRDRVQAEYDELVGMHVPGLAAPLRDSLLTAAVTHFAALGYTFKVPALLERRGRHRLEMGQIEEGHRDFRRALAMTDSQLVGARNPAQRASLVRAKADAVDALVASHLSVGDTLAALVDLDRARAAASARTAGFWDSSPGRRFAVRDSIGPPGLDGAVIAYAVVGSRALAWTVGATGVDMIELPVSGEDLARMVARLRFLLQTGASAEAVAPLARSLHTALIDPLAPYLEGVGALTIVPDGPLHGLPFSVLGEIPGAILDEYRLTHAQSVAFALASWEGGSEPAGPTVAATATTGTNARYAALPVLRFAEQEAEEVARLHATEPVRDPSADELAASLEHASLFHFAGHGLFRSDRPDLSELVLPGASGGLPASRIATLDLSGLELAVLAACSTQEADDGRSGGLSGLTWSFLEAGAGGVIGSLWAVPDAATSELMVRLHERLAAGEPSAEALRAVQSEAARDGGGWGWAAFRYEGAGQSPR